VSRILLGVSASVALYKACDLASKLAQAGHEVRTVLTPNAARLVSPQLFEAVTGGPAQADEWGAERRGAMDHIALAEGVELLVVAPASADCCARLAQGLAGDLLGTVALALAPGTRRLLAPAMNPNMLAHPATQRNLARLVEDGWQVVEPDAGHMACGVEGRGRLADPEAIRARVEALLAGGGR
jgi:phosphopantothenoylcysteine decarboxylase/phosphopantothenate--cysteine ligase